MVEAAGRGGGGDAGRAGAGCFIEAKVLALNITVDEPSSLPWLAGGGGGAGGRGTFARSRTSSPPARMAAARSAMLPVVRPAIAALDAAERMSMILPAKRTRISTRSASAGGTSSFVVSQ